MSQIQRVWVENSYKAYVVDWLLPTWRDRVGSAEGFAEMILWYTVAGSKGGSNKMADTLVNYVRGGHPNRLPNRRRPTWEDARKLAKEVCYRATTNPVDWFTGGCGNIEIGWKRLDEIFGIGPKIASLLMRDLSFLRDYTDGRGEPMVGYREKRDPHGFNRLPPEDQALCIPIDVWVHSYAKKHKASVIIEKNDSSTIQSDCELHRKAATEIVRWTRERELDPRDMDVYWYSLGAGDIHEDGTPTE